MKVAKSYASLLNGVSQQVAHSRAPGQHTEQINMLSDPVNGLIRRRGSVFLNETLFKTITNTDPDYATLVADTATWSSLEWTTGSKDYVVLYRKGSADPSLPAIVVYNKTDNVFLTTVSYPADTGLATLRANGIACIAPVGKYLYACVNGVVAAGNQTEKWNTQSNLNLAAVWIKQGIAKRTYKLTLVYTSGARQSVSYTTPAASYEGTLTTSDIPASASDYTKQVNDRVNAYNSAVTSWISTAAAQTTPQYIASQLATAISTYVAGGGITTSGSTIGFAMNPAYYSLKSIEVDDGGDGSAIRAVADEIDSTDKLTTQHHNNKVIKVRSKNSTEAYYLKSVSKTGVTSGLSEVSWVESGTSTKYNFSSGLFNFTIYGDQFYMASSPSALNGLVPGGIVPQPISSDIGDDISNPQPAFVGKQITYLGVFQSRLLVGSGGTLTLSKTDDYLNFYRSTVLTVPADDSFEMTPQGSESDELRYSVLYDQNQVIFGKRRQYLISGAQSLTPTSANMPVMSNYRDVVDTPPIAAGGLIFYTKRTGGSSGFHQIQPGQNYNSPDSFPISSQLTDYITGGIVGMTYLPGTPSYLFARSDGYRNGLYVFSYLDVQGGRKLDSWSKWEFSSLLGNIIGISSLVDKLLIFSIRSRGSLTYLAVDSVSLAASSTGIVYLDSQRSWGGLSGSMQASTTGGFQAAYDSSTVKYLRGDLLSVVNVASTDIWPRSGLIVGAPIASYVTLTNPYMTDNKDKPILSGRLTVSKLLSAYKESSGLAWSIAHNNTTTDNVFNGRIIGGTNILGVEPITTGQQSIPVGRETRDYSLTISSRKWCPLNITAIEWSGQFFNRTQRF